MSPEIGTIRVSQQGKDQLTKLKRATGIKNWNVLCRWALCVSLADESPPLLRASGVDSNVEMSWRTFAGADSIPLSGLIAHRAEVDQTSPSETAVAHLHRGIGHLAGLIGRDGSIEDLIMHVCGAEF